MIPQKLPQHWAAEAAKFDEHSDRVDFIKSNVPEHLQDLVITHLKIRREWLKYAERQKRKAEAQRDQDAKNKLSREDQARRKRRRTWTSKY